MTHAPYYGCRHGSYGHCTNCEQYTQERAKEDGDIRATLLAAGKLALYRLLLTIPDQVMTNTDADLLALLSMDASIQALPAINV